MNARTDMTTHVVHGRRLKDSDAAVLFQVSKVDDEELEKPITTWFPFSQVSSSVTRGPMDQDQLDNLRVSRWILQKKELI